MSDVRLDVYLLGEPQPDIDRATLVRNLAATFRKDVPIIEKMLRKSHSLLKSNIDSATAAKYQAVIHKAGGQSQLVTHGESLFPTSTLVVTTDVSNEVVARSELTVAPLEPTSLSQAQDDSEDVSAYSEPVARAGFKAAIAVAVFFIFIAVVGVVGAIALPAYVDYTARAKVQASLPLINETRQKVTEVIKRKEFLPSENLLAGLPEKISNDTITSIALADGAKMVVTFNIPSLNDGRNTIIWTPTKKGNEIVWDCKSGTMPDKYRTPECSGGDVDKAIPKQASVAAAPANKRFYSDDKKVSLSVPNSWQENRKLNPAAILGVSNAADEVYVMVLREPKVNFNSTTILNDYSGFIYAGLEATVPGLASLAPLQNLTINGLPAQQQYLEAAMGGNEIVYVVTTIASENNFYGIYSSTAKSRFEKNKALLVKVSESFAEHN